MKGFPLLLSKVGVCHLKRVLQSFLKGRSGMRAVRKDATQCGTNNHKQNMDKMTPALQVMFSPVIS